MEAPGPQTIRVAIERENAGRLWGAGLFVLGALLIGLDARWGEDASGARCFLVNWFGAGLWEATPAAFRQFAGDYAPGLGSAPFDLGQGATLAGWVHMVCALAAGAWLGPVLLRRVDGAVGRGVGLAIASGLAFLFATSPWLALFIAERSAQSGPGYLGLIDLTRGASFTCLWLGAGLLLGRLRGAKTGGEGLNSRASLFGAMAVAVAVPILLSQLYLDGGPLTNDGVAYQFQAELFSEGELQRDIGLVADFFPARQILPGALATSKYPPGHSLVLAPGGLLGIPKLLPALFAGWTVLLTWLLARRLRSPVGGAATWMVALSPLFLGVETLWLSHGTSIPMCALFLYSWIIARERAFDSKDLSCSPIVPALVAGAALSLAFAARPLTALAFALPCGVELAVAAFRTRKSRALLAAGSGAAGFMPGLILFFLINMAITGSGFKPAYSLYADLISPNDRWGASNLATAFPYTAYNLARLSTWLGGMGGGLALLILGWKLARPQKHAGLTLAIPFTLLALYSLHRFQGIPWVGPLYLVEAAPLFALLAAGGLLALATRLFGRAATPALFALLLTSSISLLASHLRAAEQEQLSRSSPFDLAHLEVSPHALLLIPLNDPLAQKRFPLPPPSFHANPETGALQPSAWPVFAKDLGARNRELWELLGKPNTWIWNGRDYKRITW